MPGLKNISIEDSSGTLLERMYVETFDTVERLLERHGDERLGFLGREAVGRGLDFNPQRGEFGEDVDRHVREFRNAEDHHGPREEDHDVA